jgi:hypothetical protein
VLADDQVVELREWARGLAEDDRPEFRAAARAIELLAADLLAARSRLVADQDQGIEEAPDRRQASLDWSLRNRLDRPVDDSSDQHPGKR